MYAISSDSLSKTYSTGLSNRRIVKALDNVSLHVQLGQIFSLLGPNGAGKTTFIKALLSIIRPSSGEATVLGMTVPNKAARAKIGYLPENHRFPGFLTAPQVLNLFGDLSGVSRSTLFTRIPDLLDRVGLSEWQRVKVKTYSKGMLQRLGLAHALVNDPDLLLLDEPTDGVDPVGRKEIRTILLDLCRQGKTIFLNSHLLSEVEMVSDAAAILDKGRLLKVGTLSEFTTMGSEYEIGIEGTLPEAFQQEAEALVLPVRLEGHSLSVQAASTADLNMVIDLLRKHRVEIVSVTRRRKSLEDSFLTLLQREGQQ